MAENKNGEELLTESLTKALSQEYPDRAFDPISLIPLISGIFQIFQNCRSESSMVRQIKRGSVVVKSSLTDQFVKRGHSQEKAFAMAESMAEDCKKMKKKEIKALIEEAQDYPVVKPVPPTNFWSGVGGILLFISILTLGGVSEAQGQEETNFWTAIKQQESRINAHDVEINEIRKDVSKINRKLSLLIEGQKEYSPSPQEAEHKEISESTNDLVFKSPTSTKWTQAELDQWVRSRYSPNSRLNTAEMARGHENQVWDHLIQGAPDHAAFDSSQVSGLERWVALALHDASHAGKISPNKPQGASIQVKQTASREPVSSCIAGGIPTTSRGSWLYWSHGGRNWNNQGWGIREGQTYGQGANRYQYRGGFMFPLGASTASAQSFGLVQRQPIRNTVQPLRVFNWGASGGNCWNGQCNR